MPPTVQAENQSGLATVRRIPQAHGGVLTPFPKGVSGNPNGSVPAGLIISNAYNAMTGLSEPEYRDIANNRLEAGFRRAAAIQWLECLGADVGDFQPFLQGQASLAGLRARGVNTRMVKKVTIRRGEDGSESRSVELRHGGEALDRIADRTVGKPSQFISVARVERDPLTIMHDLAGLLASDPTLLAEMRAELGEFADGLGGLSAAPAAIEGVEAPNAGE